MTATAMVPVYDTTEDSLVINSWLEGRPTTTAAAYRADVLKFFAHVQKLLAQCTVMDVQNSWSR